MVVVTSRGLKQEGTKAVSTRGLNTEGDGTSVPLRGRRAQERENTSGDDLASDHGLYELTRFTEHLVFGSHRVRSHLLYDGASLRTIAEGERRE